MEGSTKIVNFNTPMAEVLMLGRGHISHFSEYVLSSTPGHRLDKLSIQ